MDASAHRSQPPAAMPESDRRVVLTADVGGTFVKSGVIGPSGLHTITRHPTGRERGGHAVTADLVATLQQHRADAERHGLEPYAVGVAVTGVVDEDHGIAVDSAAFDWRHFPLGDHLAAALGLPVTLSHDVRAGGRAECRFGAGADRQAPLFVALGTGIAVAVAVAGQVIAGPTFQVGEIGQHRVADPDTAATNHAGGAAAVPLEAVASASAIAARYRRLAASAGIGTAATDADADADAADVADPDVANIDAANLDAAAVAATVDTDPLARRVWDDAVAALAEALALTVAVIDADAIILGGGLSRAGATLVDPLREQLAARLTWRQPPPIELAHFGADAGFVGAAIAAWSAAVGSDGALATVLGDHWTGSRAPAAASAVSS